ncbi:unnamed protein product [Lathyrus oleraceus]
MYSFIDQDCWEEFVKFSTTLGFLAKSKKGKLNRSINVYPHRLSRGGYDKLEKKMIEEKRKQREQKLGNFISLDRASSPLSRHEKWKKTCQKKGGEFTSKATREVAEKIDVLVEESKVSLFFPEDRRDILIEAIRTEEHRVRVHGLGRGIGFKTYFGRS